MAKVSNTNVGSHDPTLNKGPYNPETLAGAGTQPPGEFGPTDPTPAGNSTPVDPGGRIPTFDEILIENKERWKEEMKQRVEEREAISEVLRLHQAKKRKPVPPKFPVDEPT